MADLNISSFVSTKVLEFLSKFDTDKSGVIEESNGELANLLSGIKNGELENVDSVSFSSTSKTSKRAAQNIDFDAVVDHFNKLDLFTRQDIASDTRINAQNRLQDMAHKVDSTILEAMNPTTIDPNMYKHYNGLLEYGIKQYIEALKNNYCEQAENTRQKVQDAIREYDSRYATDPNLIGVIRFDTSDTRIVTQPIMLDLSFMEQFPSSEELANMNEAERDSKLQILDNMLAAKYMEGIVNLFNASKNIQEAITKNHEKTADSIDEVAQNGNLTHEVVNKLLLSGPTDVDQFNIEDTDPVTYREFLSQIVDNYNTTGIAETTGEKAQKDGKFVKDGQVFIRKNGQVYDLNGNKVQ